MNRNDQATRRTTTAIVVAVVLFAAGDSYSHIYDLARAHGQNMVSAGLLPLAGDGLIAAASSAILAAARAGKPVPLRARLLLFLGIGATIAANVAYGLPEGLTGALLSVWPVAAYCGCLELLAWMREHLGVQPKKASAPAKTASVAASETASGETETDAPEDELQDRRERKTRQPLTELLALAEQAFPSGMNTAKGRPASLRGHTRRA